MTAPPRPAGVAMPWPIAPGNTGKAFASGAMPQARATAAATRPGTRFFAKMVSVIESLLHQEFVRAPASLRNKAPSARRALREKLQVRLQRLHRQSPEHLRSCPGAP